MSPSRQQSVNHGYRVPADLMKLPTSRPSGNWLITAGTVFELVAQVRKGSYKEKVLWSFNSTDGFAPSGNLILDSAGNLYGTTDGGGNGYPFGYGYGVAFELTP